MPTAGALAFQSYTVAGQILNVISGRAAYSVVNTGANPVYLSDQSSFSVATGIALGPGSTILWDDGRDLYLLATAALPTTVNVYANSGGIFDAGAIASQIIAQGLAGDIADLIELQGAPPINISDPIALLQFTTTGADFTSIVYDVAKYQSVTYFLGDAEGAFAVPLPRKVTFQWLDLTGTVVIASDVVYITGTNGNLAGTLNINTQGAIPVRSSKLRVVYSATARTGTTAQIFINGSYRTLDYIRYKNATGYFGAGSWIDTTGGDINDGFQWMNGAKVAGAAVEYPSSRAGYVQMQLAATNVAVAALEAIILDLVDGKRIASLQVPILAATSVVVDQFILPNIPISISLTNAATAASVAVSLTYLP